MTDEQQIHGARTKEEVVAALRNVLDPDLRMNVVDLGLIYEVAVKEDHSVHVRMTLTTPLCPYGPELVANVKTTLLRLKGVTGARVDLVFEPPWSVEKMSEEAKLELGLDG